jgi:hypothetical protein
MAKKETVKKVKEYDFTGKTEVQFISNGSAKSMPKGKEYIISVDTAKIFLKQNYGEVK